MASIHPFHEKRTYIDDGCNHDARECLCRDTGYVCNEGRECPRRMAQQRPKFIPRSKRSRIHPVIGFIFIAVVAVLCAMSLVHIATEFSL